MRESITPPACLADAPPPPSTLLLSDLRIHRCDRGHVDHAARGGGRGKDVRGLVQAHQDRADAISIAVISATPWLLCRKRRVMVQLW